MRITATIGIVLAVLGNLLLIVGTITPWWWKVRFTLEAFGASDIIFGPFQVCHVWFCDEEANTACNTEDELLGKSRILECDVTMDSPNNGFGNHWRMARTMACLGLIFGSSASFMLVSGCFSKYDSGLVRVGSSMTTLLAGLCGAVSVFIFYFVTMNDNLRDTASSMTILDERGWVPDFHGLGFSFWSETFGSILSIIAGLTLAYSLRN